ncbi:MAG: hypothetical protein WBX25_33450 [Rhodomicrobium sp.]
MKKLGLVIALTLIGGASLSVPTFARECHHALRAEHGQGVLVNREADFDPFHFSDERF